MRTGISTDHDLFPIEIFTYTTETDAWSCNTADSDSEAQFSDEIRYLEK
jgi:hypothetical protein